MSATSPPSRDTRSTIDKARDAGELGAAIGLAIRKHPGGTIDAVVIALLAIAGVVRHHSPDGDESEEIFQKIERLFSNTLREQTPPSSRH